MLKGNQLSEEIKWKHNGKKWSM